MHSLAVVVATGGQKTSGNGLNGLFRWSYMLWLVTPAQLSVCIWQTRINHKLGSLYEHDSFTADRSRNLGIMTNYVLMFLSIKFTRIVLRDVELQDQEWDRDQDSSFENSKPDSRLVVQTERHIAFKQWSASSHSRWPDTFFVVVENHRSFIININLKIYHRRGEGRRHHYPRYAWFRHSPHDHYLWKSTSRFSFQP